MSIEDNTANSGSVQNSSDYISSLFELSDTSKNIVAEYQRRGWTVSDEAKLNIRMQLCSGCKCFDIQTARCNLCGNFMKIHVRLESSRCPVGKW